MRTGVHPRIPSPPRLRRATSSLGRRSFSEGGKSEGMLRSKTLWPKKIAPRPSRGAIVSGSVRRLELHSDTGIERLFGTAVRAHNGAVGKRRVTDTEFSIVIEAELVLPVAIGDPDVHEVGVLLAPHRLGGVEGQTDRFAVEFGLAGRAGDTDT